MNGVLRRLLFLPPQSSTFAPMADHLHYSIFLAGILVGGVSFGFGLYWMVRYRYRGSSITENITSPLWLESIFVGVPLSVFLIWFVIGFHDYLWATTPPKDAMDIYVTAKQWMWKFSYPGGPSAINELRVPLGRPVRLLITSRDVIHSFFVPDFRLKQDAVPDRYSQTWFEATQAGPHQILCAEYCGLQHSDMRGEVSAMDGAAFDQWLAKQREGLAMHQDSGRPGSGAPENLAEEGKEVAREQGCFKCHTIDGSPHIGPTWLDLYGRTETLDDGSTVVADEAYLTQSMMDPLAKVVKGFKPVMPAFQGKLSPADTAALLEYIKSLRSGRLDETPSREPVYEPRP